MLVVVKVRKKTTEAGVCRYPAKRQPEGVECGVGQQGAMFERKRVSVLRVARIDDARGQKRNVGACRGSVGGCE